MYDQPGMSRAFLSVACLALAPIASQAATLTVSNTAGNLRVVNTAGNQLLVSGRTPNGAAGRRDIELIQEGEDVLVKVLPRDSSLDLTITLPLGFALDASTIDGDISVDGMVHSARLETRTGAIVLKAPLAGLRVTLDAAAPPSSFVNPDRRLFRTSDLPLSAGQPWRLRDRLDEGAIIYGDYRITAEAPSSVELKEFEPPAGWPLRFHSDAAVELQRTLEPSATPGESSSSNESASVSADGDLVFSTRVRMVNLSVAVSDAKGSPVPGLTAANFHIDEDGAAQRIGAIQDGDAAFNLAIVLDMSDSSIAHRDPIQAAARRFVEMARPGDRVAIYALTYGMFQVVSPLSSDREALLDAVEHLPGIAGASPIYDIVTLAYTQELRQLPGERNAIIVISDGLDNRLSGGSGPSAVKFDDLERMAKEMHAIIYPVVLLSMGRPDGRPTVRLDRDGVLLMQNLRQAGRRMEALAKASGGRVFPARSIEDLEPVFPLVEAELRSVYTLGYYPENQNLDDGWRTVDVTVDKPNVTVRARPGYFAK